MDPIFLGFLADMDFLIKIFFVLTVITFVKQKITNNTLSVVLISLAIIITVFVFWPFFRATYILYVLLTIGVTSVLVDMFFVSMGEAHGGEAGGGEESSAGLDAMQQKESLHHSEHVQHQIHQAHQAKHAAHQSRRMMPMR